MAEPTFIIAPDGKSITCLVCGAMSDDSQPARDYLLDTDEDLTEGLSITIR
jgi:hypothetical protein